jgi:hypothetical protein
MSICVYMQYMVYMVYMVHKCVYFCMLYVYIHVKCGSGGRHFSALAPRGEKQVCVLCVLCIMCIVYYAMRSSGPCYMLYAICYMLYAICCLLIPFYSFPILLSFNHLLTGE